MRCSYVLLTFFVVCVLFFISDKCNFVALHLERRDVEFEKRHIIVAHEPREKKNVFLPKDSILVGNGRFLWCPNAKVGTTTMYDIWKNEFGEFDKPIKRCLNDCSLSAWRLMKTANGRQKVLNATSFTIVRNSWDRIRSAYEDKIVTGKIRPRDGPTGRLMTFVEFILYVENHPHHNRHWMSFAERCSTSSNVEGKAKFHYDYIVRMEEFDKGLEKVFAHANLEYHPYKKTLIMFLCLLTEQTTTDNTQQI